MQKSVEVYHNNGHPLPKGLTNNLLAARRGGGTPLVTNVTPHRPTLDRLYHPPK